MNLKDNTVKIENLSPKIRKVLDLLDQLWPIIYPNDADGLNVTSGHEETAKHSVTSKHYIRNCVSGTGEAFDVRTRDVEQWKAHLTCTLLWIISVLRFNTMLKIYPEALLTENAHIHVELIS